MPCVHKSPLDIFIYGKLCIKCRREKGRRHYRKHKDKVLEKCAEYRRKHPEKIIQMRQAYKAKLLEPKKRVILGNDLFDE